MQKDHCYKTEKETELDLKILFGVTMHFFLTHFRLTLVYSKCKEAERLSMSFTQILISEDIAVFNHV